MKKLLFTSSLVLGSLLLCLPVFADNELSNEGQLIQGGIQNVGGAIVNGVNGNLNANNIGGIIGTIENLLGSATAIATGTFYQVFIPPATIIPSNNSAILTGTFVGLSPTIPHMSVVYGDSPANMINTWPIYFGTKILTAGTVLPFSKKLPILQPGTKYYFYPYDVDHNITYPVQTFTTLGTPVETTSANGHAVLAPDGASFALEIWGVKGATKTDLTLKGRVIPLRSQPLTLTLKYGTSPSSLGDESIVLLRSTLHVGDESRQKSVRDQLLFEYKFTGLKLDTAYYFQFKDTTHNIVYDIKSFTIPSVAPAGSSVGQETIDLISGVIASQPEINDPYEKTGLVPCGSKGQKMCEFKDFIKLIGNVIDYILILIVPIIAIMCVYTGVQIIIQRENADELTLAKSRMLKILIGIAVIMLAWVGVGALYKALDVPKDYVLLDIFN